MKNKINVAKLLKDCPEGMELDCTIWDNVTLVSVDNEDIPFPIKLSRKNDDGSESYFVTTEYGQYYTNSKCVIFPKGKTTWEGFIPPCQFKDGDVVVAEDNESFQLFLLKHLIHSENTNTHDGDHDGDCYFGWDFQRNELFEKGEWRFNRLASEEEKQKLFQAIKDNGYKWNPETKTLEKLPKFKTGDKIIHKSTKLYCTLGEYSEGISAYRTNIGLAITYKDLEQWELIPQKFDITTLVPFESRVLVRDIDHYEWEGAIFGRYDGKNFYTIGGLDWKCCIPYEGNEHLLGTKDDCNEFYKTWEE